MINKILIKNAAIFDGMSSSLLKNTDILLEENRIKKIGKNITTDAIVKIIDGSKFTVIPGLIDCHIHFRSWMPPLFFQFGVTTVRDVGNDPDWIISLREKEKNGDNSLPRIVCYGPLLDGVPAYWGTEWKGSVELDSLETARKVTKVLIKKGVDGFKTYFGLSQELLREIVKIANKANIPVTSHLGWKVSVWDAAGIGVNFVEHADGIIFPVPSENLSWYINLLLKHNVYVDPTLTVNDVCAYIETAGNENYPHLDLIPPEEKKKWLNWKTESWLKDVGKSRFKEMQRIEVDKAKFIAAFHKAGGKVVAGSDTPNSFVVPGFSLHQEVQKMVEIGLTPVDALKTATSIAAELLRKKDIGAVKEGNLADLVLIQGNPTSDISQLSNIDMVIKNGKIVYQRKS